MLLFIVTMYYVHKGLSCTAFQRWAPTYFALVSAKPKQSVGAQRKKNSRSAKKMSMKKSESTEHERKSAKGVGKAGRRGGRRGVGERVTAVVSTFLKGQWHKIFWSAFFASNSSLGSR